MDLQIIDITDRLPINPRAKLTRMAVKPDGIALHCTAGPATQLPRAIAEYHTQHHKWHNIAYHYLVDADGTIYKCLHQDTVGWHAHHWSRHFLAVSLIYPGGDTPPPARQLEAAVQLCGQLCATLGIDTANVRGHRELKGSGWIISPTILRKVCPGMKINLDSFRTAVRAVKLSITTSGRTAG